MCNRYSLNVKAEQLRLAFAIDQDRRADAQGAGEVIRGEYFPSSAVPIIRHTDAGRELTTATWGITLGKHRVTNSRDDKAATTWKRFLVGTSGGTSGGRVVFPVGRAVEWRYPLDLLGQPHGKPTPWELFPADESIAAVAAIAAGGGDDETIGGVSMMTCRAEGITAEVHNKKPDDPRMVVFLPDASAVSAWLDPAATLDDVRDLLKPAPAGWLAGQALGQTDR